MKKTISVLASIGFVATLGAGPVFADDFVTACVKEKGDGSPKGNTTFKNVAIGTSPGKDCGNKKEQVTLVTDQLADSLQSQINANAANIATNTSNIATNTTNIATNTTNIASNEAGIVELGNRLNAITTIIGGSSGVNDLMTTDSTQYMGMFVGRLRAMDRNVENRIPVAGTLTNFWARQAGPDPTTGDATRLFTVLLRTPPDEPVATALNCIIAADEFVCADDLNCVEVSANQRISVRIDNDTGTTGTLEAVEANWSAAFTPGAVCPL